MADIGSVAQELLRPPPHRGPLVAAGSVVLAVGIALEEIRLDDKLPTGVHALILLLAGALVFWLGAQAPNEDERPPAYQSVLLVTGLLLLYPALLTLADVLGADFDGFPAGAFVWTSLLLALTAAGASVVRRSAVCLLIAAIAGGIFLLSLWRFVFGADSQAPYRWLLLLIAIGLALASLALRAPAPRHAEQLVNASGLAIAAIAVAALAVRLLDVLSGLFSNQGDFAGVLPGFWELVLLGAGCGLVAFGAVDRSPGPAYLGVLNLILFILVVAESPTETLYWWPLLLLLLGGAALAAGLRPRRPLPPEPTGYRAGEQPLAARTEDDEVVVRVRDDTSP